MPAYALLLVHDEHPSPTTQWPSQPGGSCNGWAEWFTTTPLLFNVLMGDAQHLPQVVPFRADVDRQAPSALAAPMDQVKARWQWLKHSMEPRVTQWTEALQKQWQEIDTTITTSPRQWLLLDCTTLCPHDVDTPEFLAFVQTQRDLCLQWQGNEDHLPESLQNLEQLPQTQMGWWSPAVIARTGPIERDEENALPAWLSKDYELHERSAWEDDITAYGVWPRLHPRTGQKLPDEDHRDDWPMGLVTPYGRWLQKPDEEASGAYASEGHINVLYPEEKAGEKAGESAKSGIKDLNGLWVISPAAGYRDLCVLTPHVVQCQSLDEPQSKDLRSLPGLEMLQAHIIDANWHPDDGTLRAYRGTHTRDLTLVLDAFGKPLFDSHFESVYDFDPKTGLAVAAIREPFRDSYDHDTSRILEGVIHISGAQIIPCEFESIERSFRRSPPKFFPGSKILAYTHEGKPRVFNTQGALLSAPDIWCPSLSHKLKKNELMTLRGKLPEAELGWFSIKDYAFTPTGQTWGQYIGTEPGN